MPYKIKGTIDEYNESKFQSSILNSANYKNFGDIKIHNQPRAAYFFGDSRRHIVLAYVQFLLTHHKKNEAKKVFEKLNILMPVIDYPLSKELEERVKNIEKLLME